MSLILKSSRKAILLFLLLLLTGFGWVSPVQAAGGFAMSGSFYAQQFELPQGSILSVSDVYVVVFNNTDGDFNVKMTPETPFGVELILSEDDFWLESGEQNKVEIGIDVGQEAIPGKYKIGVIAEPYTQGTTGIQIVGAAGQEADLTVTGDAASVEIITVSPDDEPVPAMVRLFRRAEGKTFDIGSSETGCLQARVSPGSYSTSAYVSGKAVAEENFDISTSEEKEIHLTVKTVFFEGFGIVPNYHKSTGKLAMAKIVYAVNNLLQAFPEAEVRLKVTHEGIPLDEVTLINLSPLEKGKLELNYNYIPPEDWKQGAYQFQLELNIEGEVYTASPAKEMEAEITGDPAGGTDITGNTFNWPLVVGLAGGVVLLAIITVLVVRRRAY